MPRIVASARCGTQKEWEQAREQGRFADYNRVIPATIYVSETGIALVTSSEWRDWLLGVRQYIPTSGGDSNDLS